MTARLGVAVHACWLSRGTLTCSITKDTVFVYEKEWWRHHLTDQALEIFRSDLSYEEFVAAQQ